MGSEHPVFFDPHNKRWPLIRIVLYAGIILLVVVFVILGLSITGYRLKPLSVSRAAISFTPEGPGKASDGPWKPLRIGFLVDWDYSSFSSLKVNLDKLDIIIGEWLHLSKADGSLEESDMLRMKKATEYVSVHKPQAKIIPLINNAQGGEWHADALSAAVETPDSRARLIRKIRSYVQERHFSGICIDFESIGPESLSGYYSFIEEISSEFHKNGLTLFVTVPADNNQLNYRKLSSDADYVIVMAYDEHWVNSSPGPIAGIKWFSGILRKRQKEIPSHKMIIALASYAYDWEEGEDADEMSYKSAIEIADDRDSEIKTDPQSLNPMFTYSDRNKQAHQVWLLDAATIFNELVIARSFAPAGLALWRLGGEDPTLWKIFGADPPLDRDAAQKLSELYFDYEMNYEGKGEVMKIISTPVKGSRTVIFDEKSGLITSGEYIALPAPYHLVRFGAAGRKLALTFDDGPDPRYTLPILDTLKMAGVPATFFIVGSNGVAHPDILRRELAEGHDIGNHTFTHPNIANISLARLEFELSATERLLESATGRGSHLFRAPYNEDVDPETLDEMKPVELINRLGYLIVGMKIDSNDWKTTDINAIVNEVVNWAESGAGNIIVLHDSGGDRSQTVRALPKLITVLQKRGFQFVTVSDLIGKPQTEVMPVIRNQSFLISWADRLGFGILHYGQFTLKNLFLLGILLGLSRLLVIAVLAIYGKAKKKTADMYRYPADLSVAAVIPAYNEEKVVSKTIHSLLDADVPARFEIILVDDGSTDRTFEVAKKAFGDNPRVRLFSIPNEGKHNALNYAISQANADIIITLDADTIIGKDSVFHLIKHFSDPSVGAVAGNAKVGNRINLITRWQALEYITSQNMDRRALAILNSITVVPGAVGAWRTGLLKTAGGFSGRTLAEDADLTIAIRKLGYRILYEEKAGAWTEAPETIRTFMRQRYRWMYGTFQVAWKHMDALFRFRYGFLGFFALPNIFIHQIFFPIISPIMDLLAVISIVSAAVDYVHHPLAFSAGPLIQVLIFYLLFSGVDFLSAIIAFFLEKNEDPKLLIWLPLQRFYYRQLIYYVAIKTLLVSLKGKEVRWSKLERKGTVETGIESLTDRGKPGSR